MVLLRRSHKTRLLALREASQPGVPELGPGLTPEMETVERPGEMDGKGARDKKDSLFFWKKEKSAAVSELQG